VESYSTGIIPFDDRVIFVSLLHCAEFPSRLSEVAQALDAISGTQVLVVCRWLGEAWLLGTVRVSGCAGYDSGGCGALCSLGIGLLMIWVIVHCFFQEARAARFAASVLLPDRYSIVERQNLTTANGGDGTRKANSKINGRNFINPPLAACARNFHWNPATLVASAHSPEPGQWRSPPLRNKY
jgi:hypothetical protein